MSLRRIGNSFIVEGLQYLALAEELIIEKRLRAAATALWHARDSFTQSKSLDAGSYRERAQQRLDFINAELQKELASDA